MCIFLGRTDACRLLRKGAQPAVRPDMEHFACTSPCCMRAVLRHRHSAGLFGWTAPDCTDSTKKTPGRKILSFKRSGAA